MADIFIIARAPMHNGLVGLDIYVGSLTRYLAGDWELVTQKAAREAGHLPAPLAWDESPGSKHFTDRPAWDGYAALVL